MFASLAQANFPGQDIFLEEQESLLDLPVEFHLYTLDGVVHQHLPAQAVSLPLLLLLHGDVQHSSRIQLLHAGLLFPLLSDGAGEDGGHGGQGDGGQEGYVDGD